MKFLKFDNNSVPSSPSSFLLYSIFLLISVILPSLLTSQFIVIYLASVFLFLVKFKLYPSEIRSTVLNSDWFYRKMLPGIGKPLFKKIGILTESLYKNLGLSFKQVLSKSYKFSNLSYIKVTTPSFAGTILISILFIMLVIVLV